MATVEPWARGKAGIAEGREGVGSRQMRAPRRFNHVQ